MDAYVKGFIAYTMMDLEDDINEFISGLDASCYDFDFQYSMTCKSDSLSTSIYSCLVIVKRRKL